MDIEQIKALIRDVPDFPEPGIVFKDITPVLADPIAFSTIIDLIVVHFGRGNVDKVVGIEARGLHPRLAGGLPLRGRLRARSASRGSCPSETVDEEYALEYGTATLELHKDAVNAGRAGAGRRRRARDRRDGAGRRVPGGAGRRQGLRHRHA